MRCSSCIPAVLQVACGTGLVLFLLVLQMLMLLGCFDWQTCWTQCSRHSLAWLARLSILKRVVHVFAISSRKRTCTEFDKLRSAADYERLIAEQVPGVPLEWRRPIGEQCMEAPVSSTGKRCAAATALPPVCVLTCRLQCWPCCPLSELHRPASRRRSALVPGKRRSVCKVCSTQSLGLQHAEPG